MSRLTRAVRESQTERLFGAVLVLFAFRLGVRPIGDNSMFTHLRTGVDAVAGLGIPRTDPYSFTAADHRWVAQSWLPEWTYGWLHGLGGYRLVVLEQALIASLLAMLLIRLARAGSPARTVVAAGVVIGMSAPYWAPRPLLFGLVCMALLVSVVEHRRSPWLLVPLVWLWVQCHGSFPLGLAWLVALAVGQWLDWKARPHDTVRYIGGFVAGLAVSVLNPLGARLLAFPLTVGEKRSVFASIVEWRSPDFQGTAGRLALVSLVVALALLVRARVAWRDLVPVVTFVAISLVAARNLPMAAVVIAPVVGRALRRGDGADRPTRSAFLGPPPRARANRAVLATIVVLFILFGASIWDKPPLSVRLYPEKAVSFLDANGYLGPSHHVAEQDFVGNYLTLRYGRRAKVFIDDRYDMYPVQVSTDYRRLVAGRPESLGVLDHYDVDTVLWDRTLPLATILALNGRWRQVFDDDDWVVYVRL